MYSHSHHTGGSGFGAAIWRASPLSIAVFMLLSIRWLYQFQTGNARTEQFCPFFHFPPRISISVFCLFILRKFKELARTVRLCWSTPVLLYIFNSTERNTMTLNQLVWLVGVCSHLSARHPQTAMVGHSGWKWTESFTFGAFHPKQC